MIACLSRTVRSTGRYVHLDRFPVGGALEHASAHAAVGRVYGKPILVWPLCAWARPEGHQSVGRSIPMHVIFEPVTVERAQRLPARFRRRARRASVSPPATFGAIGGAVMPSQAATTKCLTCSSHVVK
jgi:hypothetical protein